MKKKVLSTLLAISSVGALSACGDQEPKLLYTLSEDKTYYVVSGFDEAMKDYEYHEKELSVVVPASYNGLPIKEMSADAFCQWECITKITISAEITEIGEKAFFGCNGLTEISLPESVTTIGEKAFFGCNSLTSVRLENTDGWKAGSKEISSSDLANRENAAKLLKESYCTYSWTKN